MMIEASPPGGNGVAGPTGSRGAGWEGFLRRAVEAYFVRWPFYLLLLIVSLLIGVLGIRDGRQLYTSTGSFFIESRTLISAQSSEDLVRQRLAPSGYVTQDIFGLMSSETFMTTVAESLGHEVSDRPQERRSLFRRLRRSIEVEVLSDNLVRVQATTFEPEESQELAAALINSYIQFQISAATAEGLVAEQFFDEKAEGVSEELLAAQEAADRFAARFPTLDSLPPGDLVELSRLREAEAQAEARFRAAFDGAEEARLIQARAETEAEQRFSFITEPSLPATHDAAGSESFYRMLSFVIVGIAITVLPAVISASRSPTVLVPDDLEADVRLPVLAVMPKVASNRLDVASNRERGAGDARSTVGREPVPSGAPRRSGGDGTAV